MYKIKIITIGKTKEKWLDDALEEYLKRLKPIALVEIVLAKDDPQLVQMASKEPLVICLDPVGKSLTSELFSTFLIENLQKGGSRLAFVIGGADGLPASLKTQPALSLSPLTFTHQMARLILVEQLYRAFEINRGSPYHK
jgi:23S rRNA (pseudouridine1915-N3)-methyltransferase